MDTTILYLYSPIGRVPNLIYESADAIFHFLDFGVSSLYTLHFSCSSTIPTLTLVISTLEVIVPPIENAFPAASLRGGYFTPLSLMLTSEVTSNG